MSDDFKRVDTHTCPMSTCAAPSDSPCRTGKGKVAIQYHTACLRLVPQVAKALNVPTPAVRKPGTAWTELPRPRTAGDEPAGHVRLGYARPLPASPWTPSATPSPRPARLVITVGKKMGQHSSPATVMRMLREHDEQTAAATVTEGT